MFDHSFDELLKQRPELQEKYGAFLEAVNENGRIPHAVLAACQSRVRQVHGLEVDNQLKPSSEAERLALVVAEKMPFHHHDLRDDEVRDVKEAFGDGGCVALLTAIAFFDAACRLELTFKGVI